MLPVFKISVYQTSYDGTVLQVDLPFDKIQNSIESIKTIPLGDIIGSGEYGKVFLDKNDDEFLFKFFFNHDEEKASSAIIQELFYFRLYYGEDSAQLIKCEDKVYMRMLKIPGVLLSELPKEELPSNIEQLYMELFARLTSCGIYHADLYPHNILYCSETKTLFPIDFTTVDSQFPTLSQRDKCIISAGLQSHSQIIKELYNLKWFRSDQVL